ncbi:hypothetical protein OM427_28045 [Halomonas sp. 18H]|nr:protein YgfX [Halomonas sp. 18H]MCW4153370.1 hypothetical protein [Halomonas sp. 18H]
MPKTPITLPIKVSRLSTLLHGGLAIATVAWLAWITSGWLALAALVVLPAWLVHLVRQAPSGEWQLVVGESANETNGANWRWRAQAGHEWQSRRLYCDHLGPWLIGLKGEGHRLWLWPDCTDPARLRSLRRVLLREAGRG